LEYEVHGHGEPVLLIAPSVVADGLARPLIARPEFAARYRLIHYRRRGYRGSTRGHGPLTVSRQAADAAGLLRLLEVRRAHVVGHSTGGAIALQLTRDAPDLVHSLALLEPAVHGGGPAERAHVEQTVEPSRERYRAGDKRGFVLFFLDGVCGPGWRPVLEHAIPGATEQAIADADILYEEQPMLGGWAFGADEAAVIKQPVLAILGARSAPVFHEGHTALRSWLPQAEELVVATTHLLQLEDPAAVVRSVAAFCGRHPMP
jgi:pimeloyl-ACP methyl ester carboxylesterase